MSKDKSSSNEDEQQDVILELYHEIVKDTEGIVAKLRKRRQEREAKAFEKRLKEIKELEEKLNELSEQRYSNSPAEDDFGDY